MDYIDVITPEDSGNVYCSLNRQYTFVGAFGRKTMTHAEYLNTDIRKMVRDPDYVFMNLGLTLLVYPKKWLRLEVNQKDAASVRAMQEMYDENPLRFFLPSGDGGIEFLNDLDHDVKAMQAPNRIGKTAEMVVDILLDGIPTGPDWHLFRHHYVQWRKWGGKQQIGFATADWTVMRRTLWPEIRKWIPKYELGEYDPRLRNAKDIAWRNDPSIKLRCGTELFFFVYEQKQGPYESQALDRFGWDEQGEEAKFDGADERLRTRDGRHVFALTPHQIEGRADTGARSWIHSLLTSETTKGHTVSVHKVSIPEVPDWVYSTEAKIAAYKKWVEEPTKQKKIKVLAEGRARFYGEWHDTGGLFYDDWKESVHVIDQFRIPDSWTRYRGIDHGNNVHPTVCLWGAVNPEGDLYIYREYFEIGLRISKNCEGIIKFSGNKRVQSGRPNNKEYAGIFYERFREDMCSEKFLHTVMDVRSAHSTDPVSMMTIEEIYRLSGLSITPASGKNEVDSAPAVREFMAVDPDKPHPYRDEPGCSRMFVMRNCTNFIRQIRGFAREEHASSKVAAKNDPQEKGRQKDKDAMDALRYLCQIPPRYIKGRWAFNEVSIPDEDEGEEINRAVIVRAGTRKKRAMVQSQGY